jgi:hypothetical protein
MELTCALLTGFLLWLFLFHFFWNWRARLREEAGPLLLDVKATARIVRVFRWQRWLWMVFILAAPPSFAIFLYRLGKSLFSSFPNLLVIFSYDFEVNVVVIGWSFFLLMLAFPPFWPKIAAEIRERGILFSSYRFKLWSQISQVRWFSPRTKFEVAFWWWRPWPYNRFRVTLDERRIAAGQKEAVTAVLARFVQVYDHDGTLLAGPSQVELMAKAGRPVEARARSWLQFNLQSLLLLAVVVSCGASCYGIHCRRLLPHRQGVAQLKVLGAAIDCLGEIPWRVDFSKCSRKPSDDDLACLEPLDQLSSLDLSGSPITDAGLEHLKGLRHLTYVNCRNTKVTAKGAAELLRILPNAAIIYGPNNNSVVVYPPDWP